MAWDEAKQHAALVRKLGIQQLISVYHKFKGNARDVLLWGDEIEYLVVSFDDDKKTARLSLRQEEILEALGKLERAQLEEQRVLKEQAEAEDNKDFVIEVPPKFHPEFGRFMLESTPGAPYGMTWASLLTVEKNMKLRYVETWTPCWPRVPLTLTSFPRLGAPGVFTDPYYPPTGSKSRSQFLPDELINLHIRFPTLAANIRSRRGAKVAINMPIFYDINTPRPFRDPTIDYDRHLYPEDADVRNGAAKEGHIYMDAMGFGMGCCCLQITFQAKNLEEARTLYDQLAPLGPIMLALTAAAPIFKGFLADVDVRWNVISGAVDDRTEEERGLKPLKEDRFRIPKSRYASVSTYIAEDPRLREEYNDPDLVIDEDIKKELLDNGFDERLATHFAHLFIRDPLVIFKETLQASPDGLSDHFENIQSTNWQHMRFKPPPPPSNSSSSSIGWRVEFRSMEVQLTDFENAAYAIFVVLLTRVVLSYGLNFYIPIGKVHENMETAHARDAVREKRFWFRRDRQQQPPLPGLIPLIESYLNSINIDVETRCQLSDYLDLVSKRASGELMTGARWIREYVRAHDEYKGDSVVGEAVTWGLCREVEKLGMGEGDARRVWGVQGLLGRWAERV
ncbi:glutamate-cysteine ligase-domain-containing protein [Kalaharituber pfeilii]|nr:glutamate-cysteine ligase-domain-containing protein [Kalaharituber pfeilii]